MTARQRRRVTIAQPEPPDDATGPAPAWTRHAACKGKWDLFFSDNTADIERAQAICGGCLVRVDCRAYARSEEIEYGIWGGVTEDDRKAQRSGGTKPCSNCAVPKPLSEYHKASTTRDGRAARCKTCDRDRRAARPPVQDAVTPDQLEDAGRRRDAGETVTAIAADLGVSRGYLSRLLASSRHPEPDLEEVA